MDHPPNYFLQTSPSLPDLPLSPARRQLQLSDMIIPNSRIKLVETLGEGNYVALCYNKLLDTGCIDWTHWHMYQIPIHTHTHTNIYIYSHTHAHTHTYEHVYTHNYNVYPNAASCGRFGVVYKAHLLSEGTPSQEMTVALKTPRGA